MIGKETKQSEPVSISEVAQILEERKEKELSYEQQVALEHAKKFAITKAQHEKARKALEALDVLDKRTLLKVLDIMPRNAMLLRQVLAQTRKSYDDETVNKILAITKG